MTYYAIYSEISQTLIGGTYPLVISDDTKFLEQHLVPSFYIKKLNSIPHQEEICAEGKWFQLKDHKNTFTFSNENPLGLESISHKDLSEILFNS